MDSRQSHIWSHGIGIHFQLHQGFRLNLQEINSEYEKGKWLRGSTSEHRGSTGEQGESTSEHRGSMGEQRGSMREHRGSIWTKRALAEKQSGEALISIK